MILSFDLDNEDQTIDGRFIANDRSLDPIYQYSHRDNARSRCWNNCRAPCPRGHIQELDLDPRNSRFIIRANKERKLYRDRILHRSELWKEWFIDSRDEFVENKDILSMRGYSLWFFFFFFFFFFLGGGGGGYVINGDKTVINNADKILPRLK